MRNSLIIKLMVAFLLVIAIGALVMTVLTSQATQNAFNLYTTRSGQNWAQRLAPVLADYYIQTNSWQGVESFVESDIIGQNSPSATGQGRGFGSGSSSSAGMAFFEDQRVILADFQGIVVSDTQNELIGKQVSASELKNGTSVIVNDNLVGTLIITPNSLAGVNSPASDFISSVKQAIINSAVIAGIIALVIGAFLAFQITSPLRQLRNAANEISKGDLNQRVKIKSHDELGELGLAFNHMAKNLSDAEMQRQHLIADVAHELRTPLSAILGTLEGMQDGFLPLDNEQITTLHEETSLLNRLVGDLRLISLAETGQLKLELEQTQTGDFLQKVTDRVKNQAQQKNILLKLEIQPNLPDIMIDSDRITQVISNLIANALRYTPEGGLITVQASVLNEDNSIQVSVTDTGPGIDRENLPYVFDRFYRADKSRTRASGGSGLGLAIVKQLVEAHGGKVFAKSPVFPNDNQRGYGTSVIFTLPISMHNK